MSIGLIGGLSDFDLCQVEVRPRERTLRSSITQVTVEPLVIQLLVILAKQAGQLVTRRAIFDACWGPTPVGDDSLNRVIAALRKSLRSVAGDLIQIDTVPSAGYVLRLSRLREIGRHPDDEVADAVQAGLDSWRLALPEPDHLRIEQLRRACALDGSNAKAWGFLALLCRHAAEYGEPITVLANVQECQSAARQAVALDPAQPEARTALTTILPLFGHWQESRDRLLAILEGAPESVVATQELATLEMATGRVREGKRLRDGLIARDPLAAAFCYKSIYQHWSVGDVTGMDHAADRAIQLWPTHPAVWMARLWTLAFTNRIPAAAAMLDDAALRPALPQPALAFLRQSLSAAADPAGAGVAELVRAGLALSRTGPANAIAAMFALSLVGRAERAFDIAEGYYLRSGDSPVPVSHTHAEISLNEQHRRLTQVLFTPVFAPVRADQRFTDLCDRIGLVRYWEETGAKPDFLS